MVIFNETAISGAKEKKITKNRRIRFECWAQFLKMQTTMKRQITDISYYRLHTAAAPAQYDIVYIANQVNDFQS